MKGLTCSVAFSNGIRCTRAASRVTGWCKDCSRWSHNNGVTPNGRRHKRGNGELRAKVAEAASMTSEECFYVDYGSRLFVRHNGTSIPAARAVWIKVHGNPGELHVLHRCHNGDVGCININCLYLGTPATNMRDMALVKRSANGTRHGMSKLSDEQVKEIRKTYVHGSRFPHPGNARVIGQFYGVHPAYVRELCRGERRKELTSNKR